METQKIRIKIGDDEFEASGSEDLVRAQFEAFQELIKLKLSKAESKGDEGEGQARRDVDGDEPEHMTKNRDSGESSLGDKELGILFKKDEKKKLVTLLLPPPKTKRYVADAIMLILMGSKLKMGLDEVPVTSLKPSLSLSGIKVQRVDRAMAQDEKDGLVLKAGRGKGGRYRLTNRGIAYAEKLMADMLKVLI